MAKGKFVHSKSGYAFILNQASEIRQVCEAAGSNAMREATALGGSSAAYTCDTVSGVTRFHTRVATERTWPAFRSEQKTHALRNTIPRA